MKNGPAALALAGASRRPRREGTSLFPAKREVKREVDKAWQAWPGNQTSSRCLVRSLVGRGGAHYGPGPQIRISLETKLDPTRSFSDPILPFLEVFLSGRSASREAPLGGGHCSPKPPPALQPSHSSRMHHLTLSGQVGWSFCLRGAEEEWPSLAYQMEPLAMSA